MSTTVCWLENDVTRIADFEELFRELVEEAGRALEAGDLGYAMLLQGVLIPKIEDEGLKAPRRSNRPIRS